MSVVAFTRLRRLGRRGRAPRCEALMPNLPLASTLTGGEVLSIGPCARNRAIKQILLGAKPGAKKIGRERTPNRRASAR